MGPDVGYSLFYHNLHHWYYDQIKFCLFAKWQVISWWGDSEKQ